MNGHSLTIKCSHNYEYRYNHTKWYTASLGNNVVMRFGSNNLVGHVRFEYLKVYRPAAAASSIILYGGGQNVDSSMYVNSCYLRGTDNPLIPNSIGIGYLYEYNTVVIQNTRVWNCIRGMQTNPGAGVGGDYPNKRFVENCVFYNCTAGVWVQDNESQLWTFRNVAACDCNLAFEGLGATGLEVQVIEGCAVDDGTLTYGSPVYNDLVPEDEFASLDDTNFKFLGLKNDGYMELTIDPVPDVGRAPLEVIFNGYPLFDYGTMGPILPVGGVEPEWATTDVLGNTKPGLDDKWSIGVDEAVFYWRIT
jgi:hypothetical protein